MKKISARKNESVSQWQMAGMAMRGGSEVGGNGSCGKCSWRLAVWLASVKQ